MERRGDYKYQARANYNKTQRSKTMDVKRKQQRCNLMMHNRRIPLEEKNQIETAVSKVDKKTIGKGDRLKKLKEWQEKRKATKELEKKKQLKPFYAGLNNRQTNDPTLTITAAATNKPVTRLQVKNATSKFSTAQNQAKPATHVQGRKLVKRQEDMEMKTKVDCKPKVASKPVGKQETVVPLKPAPSKVAKDKQDKRNEKATLILVLQQTDEAWMPSKTGTKKALSTKATNFEEVFPDEKPLSPFRFGLPTNTVGRTKPFGFSMKHKSNLVFVNLSRGGPRDCAPPSPLCFRYKVADDLMTTPQQQQELQDASEEVLLSEDPLASVKRNCFHDPSNCDPVIVTSQPSKDVACRDTDLGDVGDNSSDSSDNEEEDKSKGAGHCENKDGTVEEEKDVQLVAENSSAVVMAGVSGAAPKSQEVQRFKNLHAETVSQLSKHCEVWEKKADEMISIAAGSNEEVLGQIRTAIGQAQLLVNKKLKQFLGLCQDAEEDRGERRTTPDDLQGFWDMVSHQIDDVHCKFQWLEELERNDWVIEDVPKKKPMKKLRGPAKRRAEPKVSEEQKQKLAEQREKRAAARNRLKEMKAAAKRGNLGATKEDKPMTMDDNVFEEFVSSVAVMELTTPKKKKGDSTEPCVLIQVRRSTRKTPNKYRRKSTVSRDSTSEENETAVTVQPNKALLNSNLTFFDSPAPTESESMYVTGYDFSLYVTPPSPSKTGCL